MQNCSQNANPDLTGVCFQGVFISLQAGVTALIFRMMLCCLLGVKTFLNHKHYEGTISFLPAENKGTPRDRLRCRSG